MPAPRGIARAGNRMNIGRLLEVGVAVSDLDAATRTFTHLLGAGATAPIRAPMFSMDFSMCRVGDVDFELMTPRAAESIVDRFIGARGEGLHHVAFQVPDIGETIAQCRARGLPVLSDEPVLLGGLRAAFLHPGCLSGLLVEFVENLHAWSIAPGADVRPNAERVSGFAVVVGDVDAAAADYVRVLGATISEPHWNALLGGPARYASIGGIRFELVASTASRIDPARLSGHRQGLHHVCLEVRDPQAFLPSRGGGAETPFLTDPAACHGVAFEIRRAGERKRP
jgi:methylmalonyl-CoA epimerase